MHVRTAVGTFTWVDVPPVPLRGQIVHDLHRSLGHVGRDKLLEALRDWYWWPGMLQSVQECLRHCVACRKDSHDKDAYVPASESWKGVRPFQGWHVDLAGPFPADPEGQRYLFVAVDPFSKWVEATTLLSKHSGRTASAMWEVICRWGKPSWITTDNGLEFAGSFHSLCEATGVVHRHITVGNSRANG